MRLTTSLLVADAWTLWRADRDVLMRVASVFMLLPALAIALLLEPSLARAMEALAPDDTAGRFMASANWITRHSPWLLLAQIVADFGALTIVVLYLDRSRPNLGTALRGAMGWLAVYVVAMLVVSLLAAIGIAALIIGYFYVLARLSLVGPVMIAEQVTNPFAAVARSVALTRGYGFTLTGLVMVVLFGGYIAQTPFNIIDTWMAVHASNPIARAIVDLASSAISAVAAVATALVQVAVWQRLSAR